ncbi:MAG TPA: crosslink repair DNA glycosylase YcaQ family protein [Actinomycetota bacterium]|nr:crosslink repair DNA glycosylase YcaQ family protein [Actinomycetota bacterium]
MPPAKTLREIPLRDVRRLAVEVQGLHRRTPASGAELLELIARLGCVQIDPISVVAPTQQLVLWSRVDRFDPAALDALLWEERSLFHYWAHAASIVPTNDYPIHALMMRRWGKGTTKYEARVREWMDANRRMRRSIVAQLREEGPARLADLRRVPGEPWQSSGWTDAQDVARMIEFLWIKGVVTIAGRVGGARLWDLMDRWLPEWTPRETWPERRVVEAAALRAVRALGVATPRQIKEHFTRGRYPGLPDALVRLGRRKEIEEVAVVDGRARLPGRWYAHVDHLARLGALADDAWEGACRLLSPFDNLVCDRARTQLVWGFEYRIEIYVPKAKRRYGYYVLPILWHDRLVGRLDAAMDRAAGCLRVVSVHAEPRAPAVGDDVRAAVEDLATFVGASAVEWPSRRPKAWARALT